MTELLTAAQMRAIEEAAIASGEVTGLELMERAGRGVVEAILDWRPALATAPHRAVVLCGPGNNGGDGFVVARLLKQRGWDVEVFLYGRDPAEVDKLPPDAAENARRWRGMGEIRALTDDALDGYEDDHPDTALAIDALFGTGLTRPFLVLGGVQTALNSWQAASHQGAAPGVVAIDMPSGVCSDSGIYLGPRDDNPYDHAIMANLTVSFHSLKLGHVLAEGSGACGDSVAVADIGLKHTDDHTVVRATEPSSARFLGKYSGFHKYRHGHALILSGGVGKGGAARLAARGALRIGAGLVTVGCPPAALQENAARLDAVMLAPVKGVEELHAEMAARKIGAVGIGPGFGLGERLRAFVACALKDGLETHPTAVVLDADALTEFRDDPETLFAMLHDGCVLTPHDGEFARLFPDIHAKLQAPATTGPAYSKVDATREAAARAGCVVLFKGADTVIADPGGRCAVNSAHCERAAPWLATAGSGDVLTGFITGLMARGFDPMAAAETAAWLHVECARTFGPGLIAEDLPEQLPAVFRDLGL